MKLLFTNWRKAKKDQIEKGRHYGGKNGEYFRCAWCGHRFKENEEYNLVMTNNLRGKYVQYLSGNPIVCKLCFDLFGNNLIKELRNRAHELQRSNGNRYWWFLRRSR